MGFFCYEKAQCLKNKNQKRIFGLKPLANPQT
jgi:hypothetical protein